jgi:anaerobic dimethyl sulfoxide reductase subunit C (anchor subunit)
MEYMELEWPLIVFTFFMCLAGGVFAMQAYLALRGKGKNIQLVSLIVTVIAFAVGGLGVFMHLEHWERMFKGFGHITSPITHEIIAVVVFAVALVLYYLFTRRSEDGLPPKWCAVLAIILGLALPTLCGYSYMMAANPVWNTGLLPLFYLADAIMMGAFVCTIIAKAKREDRVLSDTLLFVIVGTVARLIVIVVYAVVIHMMTGSYTEITYYFDPTSPDSPLIDPTVYMHAILAGDLSVGFYLLVVLMGSVVPLGIALVMNRANRAEGPSRFAIRRPNALVLASAALVATALGGVVWRCVLYWVCIQVFPYLSLG